jgi:hypothetical protein
MEIELHKKQFDVFESEATEILYGGAAGGGKSMLLRALAIAVAYDVPYAQIYLFRRESVDLVKNHLNGPSGFHAMLAPYVKQGLCKITMQPGEITFWNGSKILLCHCKSEKDIYGYQGAEIHLLLIDELTHFTDEMYRFLRGRLRLGGLNIPDRWKGVLPRIVCASNPGNIGHAFVKGMFIDGVEPYEIREMPDDEGGLKRQFIPARLEDNPTMYISDPNYEKRLMGLGSPELVRAMREGDWDIVSGAAFEKLTRTKHLVRPFKIPKHWTKFTSMDWGSAKPFSVGWYAVAEGGTLIKGRETGEADKFIPDKAVIRYREYYGWNGKPDQGCRMESYEVARKILEIERQADEKIDYRIADTAMWASDDGPSPADRMAKEGLLMRQAEKDRVAGYQEVRARIAGDEYPMLYVTSDCHNFWRTIPPLQLDHINPEKGPDTTMEDHVYDELVYALRSYPYSRTLESRIDEEYKEMRKAAKLNNRDPYSTK